MTIDRIPAPSSGGSSGISDVTGTEPIVVTSPTATTRNVAVNDGPPGSFTTFPSGVLGSIARRRIGWSVAQNQATGLVSFAQTGNTTGTASSPLITNTDFFTSATRVLLLSTTALNVRSGVAWTGNEVFRGNVADTGGFILEVCFSFVALNSSSRFLCGLTTSSTLPTLAADPSALTDAVFLGFDGADTNFQMMHNDSAGSCAKVDLGATFPKPAGSALSRDVYYLMLYCAANSGGTAQDVEYYLVRLDDPAVVTTGTLSTDLPTASTLLYPSIALGTGGSVTTATQLAFHRMQCETTL